MPKTPAPAGLFHRGRKILAPLSFPYVALAPSQSKPDPLRAYFAARINRRTDMSDFIFLALGCGTFIVFAAYARALDRL
ncbi:hypothetical protein GB927_023730 [Shinella sp. CPCC 100929]|uniref:Uncharacterized protein n=1 Tax=Shinella lacus TaxID=2654216 RepID=A0ABT1RD50_9HYPH|nr:hypothetical protein [Shinella lacus]MCQ4633072.1 hypothetical protein [Shinella lacus]